VPGIARWNVAATIIASFAVDQLSKEAAIARLISGPIDLGLIRFHLVANRGVLMGFPAPPLIVILATLGIVGFALRSSRRQGRRASIAYGLLVGGALGNLADRFLQRAMFPPNAVVDWISLGSITFNLADVALVVGVTMLLLGDSPAKPEQRRLTDRSSP